MIGFWDFQFDIEVSLDFNSAQLEITQSCLFPLQPLISTEQRGL